MINNNIADDTEIVTDFECHYLCSEFDVQRSVLTLSQGACPQCSSSEVCS